MYYSNLLQLELYSAYLEGALKVMVRKPKAFLHDSQFVPHVNALQQTQKDGGRHHVFRL